MIAMFCLMLLMPTPRYIIDNDVVMPDGKKAVPNQVMTEPFRDIFCVEHGFRPRKYPGKPEYSGAKALEFGEGLRWLDYHQAADGEYYLVCKGGIIEPITVLGWVPESALLLNNKPLTTNIKKHEVHNVPESFEGVSRKALIINSKDWVKDNNNINPNTPGEIVQPIRYLGLEAKAPIASPIKFFNILFVYKVDAKKGMVLLGFTEYASYRNSNLAGWISEKAVCYWNNREAVQWKFDNKNSNFGPKTRETRAYAFKDLKAAQQYVLRNKIRAPDGSAESIIPDPASIVAKEVIDKDGNSEPWEYDSVRFPVISNPAQRIVTTSNWGKFIEIGVIGNFEIEGGGFVSAKNLQNIRITMMEIEKEVRQNYILFVIDNTGSMEKAFQTAIPEYINAFASEQGLSEIEKSQIKIAVTFYNDFTSQAEKEKPGTTLDSTIQHVSDWISISSKEGMKLVDDLAKTKAKEGGDALEQPVHGIKCALTNAMKGDNAPKPYSFKRCVVLGDMGNHVMGNLGQNLQKEMELIADLLVPANATPWDFMPIQVPNPRAVNEQVDPDYALFANQMTEIAKLRMQRLKQQGKKINEKVLPGESVVYSNFEELKAYLVNRTKQYRQEAEEAAKGLVDLRRGVTTQLSDNLKNIFQKEGINIEVLTKNGYQFYEKGWITTHDGTHRDGREPMAQVDIKTLVRASEFKALRGLVEKFDPADSSELMDEIFDLVISGKLGQKLNADFMKKTVDKLSGINFRTPLLTYMVNKKKMPNLNGAKAKEIFADLLSRLLLLKPIYKEIESGSLYQYGYRSAPRELPGGQKYRVWEGSGNLIVNKDNKDTRRKFLLVGEESLSDEKDREDYYYYWFDDAKEIP